MNSSIWLVGIPDEFSVQRRMDLRVLMKRAIRIEERMEKGVRIEDEQKRYHTLCDRIEYLGHLISAEFPVISCDLGDNYLDFLIEISTKYPEPAAKARVTADFCPVGRLGDQLDQFKKLVAKAGGINRPDVKLKIDFYGQAIRNGWNVIELIHQKSSASEPEIVEGDLKREFLSLKVSDEVSTGENTGPFVTLRSQIKKSVGLIQQGMKASVDFGDFRHDVIAEILHEFVFSSGKPQYMPIVYGDGSTATHFPLYCLRNRSVEVEKNLSSVPLIPVGEMSSRHHELDSKVKVYWYRNQEISIGRTQGESDMVAYMKAKELLVRMRSEGVYRIGFYQTGFAPAAVGFYRALTEELIFRAKKPVSLEVTPFYFLGGVYRQGKSWS